MNQRPGIVGKQEVAATLGSAVRATLGKRGVEVMPRKREQVIWGMEEHP